MESVELGRKYININMQNKCFRENKMGISREGKQGQGKILYT
jgi:hypothetical protein